MYMILKREYEFLIQQCSNLKKYCENELNYCLASYNNFRIAQTAAGHILVKVPEASGL